MLGALCTAVAPRRTATSSTLCSDAMSAKRQKVGAFAVQSMGEVNDAASELLSCPCCYSVGDPSACGDCTPAGALAKLTKLRAAMAKEGVDAYIVPSEDAHSSEYVAAADKRRAFLTGFTGSAGVAVVTRDKAKLWTDGRYFLQATEQLTEHWELMKQFEPGVPDVEDWLAAELAGGRGVVGIDPALFRAATADKWAATGLTMKHVDNNLVDGIWITRPIDPANNITVHPESVAGESVASKLDRVRAELKDQGAGALVLNALDQIAWLYNLRGSDILCNPVFFAYTVVLVDGPATLFVRRPDSNGLKEHLKTQSTAAHAIELKEYDEFKTTLPQVVERLNHLGSSQVMVEKATCSAAMLACVPTSQQHLVEVSPVEVFKSRKNAAEVAGLRSASIKDSLAICKYFSWLELYLLDPTGAPPPPAASTLTPTESLNEFQAAQVLSSIRSAGAGCVGDSFPTISATGANAAVIHYQPDHQTSATIKADEIYLCDTGGQYTDGTTDITRTLHFGTPSEEQKRCYTRVLQGHAQLAQAVFPAGTCGLMLEMLARQPLWQDGLNYQHGTGHGMGAYLNVHEGPMGIGGGTVSGDKIKANERMKRMWLAPIEEGMYLSDEPGFYKPGEFGIRIESDLVVVKAETRFAFGARPWLRFEYLTKVPFCRALIDTSMLSTAEKDWIDAYHKDVRETLLSSLAGAEEGPSQEAETLRAFLVAATAPIGAE